MLTWYKINKHRKVIMLTQGRAKKPDANGVVTSVAPEFKMILYVRIVIVAMSVPNQSFLNTKTPASRKTNDMRSIQFIKSLHCQMSHAVPMHLN